MSFLSKQCRSVTPNFAGEQPIDKEYIKVNINESPYPPSPKVKAVIDKIDYSDLRLYPPQNSSELKRLIANKYGLEEDNVFVGNGSDEVLAFCFPAFFDSDDKNSILAFANISYSFYKVWAHIFGINTQILPLNSDFKINTKDYFNSTANGFLICNPNVPTGIALGRMDILEMVEQMPDKLFIIDEAYSDFANCSVANFVKSHDNLLVVKTFSKSYGLAGIRCGYAIGNSSLIRGLNTIKNSFNTFTVNTLTQAIACEAFKDNSYIATTIDKIITTREEFADKLREMGFEVLPSSSNFLFARHNEMRGSEIYFQLKENGILVKHYKIPLIEDFVRITIGTPDDMKFIIKVIKQILKK